VTVEGHCDERGTEAYNIALGERRAESVKNFLVDMGISANRLKTISYGEERPIAMGQDEASWAKNRRAQFMVN
jgi:peptidoglycan-associated lipoprotein